MLHRRVNGFPVCLQSRGNVPSRAGLNLFERVIRNYNRLVMSDANDTPEMLGTKIARLVEERGWNHDEFARLAELNRLTVRGIMQRTPRKLHNATVSACASALGLTVSELKSTPLEKLLVRVRTDDPNRPRYHAILQQATQPELIAWIERNAERASHFSQDEADELLSMQGSAMTAFGVARCVEIIERKRKLVEKVYVVAGTEYIDLLEQFVDLLYEKVRPYRDRADG